MIAEQQRVKNVNESRSHERVVQRTLISESRAEWRPQGVIYSRQGIDPAAWPCTHEGFRGRQRIMRDSNGSLWMFFINAVSLVCI